MARIWTHKGIILHGSRSGRADYDTADEFASTVRYVLGGASGLGWHVTIGDDEVAHHIDPWYYGWNARAASLHYLAVEFAQPLADRPISDAQVRAFCWWLEHYVWPSVPNFPLYMPTHAEVERSGETGVIDGKNDVFPYGSAEANELRERIYAQFQ